MKEHERLRVNSCPGPPYTVVPWGPVSATVRGGDGRRACGGWDTDVTIAAYPPLDQEERVRSVLADRSG